MTVQGEIKPSRAKLQVFDDDGKEAYSFTGYLNSVEMNRDIPPMYEMSLSSFGKWKSFVNDFAPAWRMEIHMTEDVSLRPKPSKNELMATEIERQKCAAKNKDEYENEDEDDYPDDYYDEED